MKYGGWYADPQLKVTMFELRVYVRFVGGFVDISVVAEDTNALDSELDTAWTYSLAEYPYGNVIWSVVKILLNVNPPADVLMK